MTDALQLKVSRYQWAALACGIAALMACLIGAFLNQRQFFISYLFAYLFWLGLALGCLGVVMLHHLTGGRWGFVVRRFLESGFRTLPLMAALFVPLCFGIHQLYPWADAAKVANDTVLQHKQIYMNLPGFIIRAVVFFAIWLVMAHLLRKWSSEQDDASDPAFTRRLRTLSGPGIVIYPLTATFAFIDWILSIEPDWYSTLFLVIIVIGQILTAFAFAVLLLALFRRTEPLAEILSINHFHHLGNLLLTFVMFWTYISFSQFLIIWSGNLPHEIQWYLHRIRGGWAWIVVALALFHFFIPFYLLLFRMTKRSVAMLSAIAAIIFIAHLVNVFWLIEPTFFPSGIRLNWMDVAAPLGIGGVWVAAFLSRLKRAPLVPLNDPRFEYAFAHEDQ